MPLEQIQTVVENFISDTSNELLVIKGEWGIGKTFFWHEIIEDSRAKKRIGRKFYSYVSLFGINNIEELKNAILVSNVESNASKSKQKISTLATNLRILTTKLENVPSLRDYTGGMVSTFLHSLLESSLICFDDIERKGEALDLKDVFGLAALLKEQRECKVVMIMNDGSLEQKQLDQFKLHGEKIIDREITFLITTEVSFGYVFQPSYRFYDVIKDCCLTLRIKNIRTLQRIKRFIDDVTPHLKGSEEKTGEDVVRSLILFVWSYYDKASDAPPLKHILEYSLVNSYIRTEYKKEELTPDVKKWDEVLNLYNYFSTNDLDKCLAEFVETGYIDKPKFVVELYKKNEQCRAQKGDDSYHEAWNIYRNSFENNEQEFVDELVRTFRSNIKSFSIRDLHGAVTTLRDFERNTLANNLVDEYFSQRETEKDIKALKELEQHVFRDELKDEYLMSRLRDIWAVEYTDERSLADVVKEIALKEYPKLEDIRHMDSFSADDYYSFFKSENSDDLYAYVRQCLDFENRKDIKGIYKSISEKTKEALRKIASESKINQRRVLTLYGIEVN